MMTSGRMMVAALLLISGFSSCERSVETGIAVAEDAQPLDVPGAKGSVDAKDFSVVDHQGRGTEKPTIAAIIGRTLSRSQLHALALHLAGKASRPTIHLMASEAAWVACGKARFDSLRGGAEPADNEACARGTLLWMSSTEPRLFHWGLAAPRPDVRAKE